MAVTPAIRVECDVIRYSPVAPNEFCGKRLPASQRVMADFSPKPWNSSPSILLAHRLCDGVLRFAEIPAPCKALFALERRSPSHRQSVGPRQNQISIWLPSSTTRLGGRWKKRAGESAEAASRKYSHVVQRPSRGFSEATSVSRPMKKVVVAMSMERPKARAFARISGT